MGSHAIALPRVRRRRLPRPPRFTWLQKLALAWDIVLAAWIITEALTAGPRPWMPLTGGGVGVDIVAIVSAARRQLPLLDPRYSPWTMSLYLAGVAVAVAL